MWIFGYGSLVWKADFKFEEKLVGYIKGYKRRFWQASIDHRGTPEKPGRVVTLVKSEDPEDKVWGVAYRISEEDKNKVLAHLDYREKGGYVRHSVTFYPKEEDIQSLLLTIYIGTEDNPFYTGNSDDEETIAQIIATAVGPSGGNAEYLFQLVKSMEQFNIVDKHLCNLNERVKLLMEG